MYYYQIDGAKFSSGTIIESPTVFSPVEIINLLYEGSRLPIYYAVDCLDNINGERVSFGFFQTWICGDGAFVRLDEHREHYATDPSVERKYPDYIEFGDEKNSFLVDFEDTVTVYQAREALEYWLYQRNKIGTLRWL